MDRTTIRALRISVLLAAVAMLGTACEHTADPATPLNRFHVSNSSTDTLLVDSATGDLWRLNESPGEDLGHWVRAAEAPGDARPWAQIVRPDENAEPPPEDHPEENQDGGDGGDDHPDDGGGENQDG